MKFKAFSSLILLILILTSCNMPGASPATEPAVVAPVLTETPADSAALQPVDRSTATPSPIPYSGVFTLSVLADTSSEPVTRDQAQTLVNEASGILAGLTNFAFEMVDFREYSGSVDSILQSYFSDPGYVRSDGIIIFSYGDNGFARDLGGYAFPAPGPAGFVSRFKSPYAPENSVYVGVIHFSHRFGECGYGGGETPISVVSVGGECRNQPGTACVEKFGYQMCGNLVNELYASTPTYMASSTFVHEIMHPFGEFGNFDHYFTAECTERMASGISSRPYQSAYFDSAEADFYVNMCPYVFDVFVNSYLP
jgi:hypothetical protein